MVGTSKAEKEENDDRFVALELRDKCKNLGTIAILFTTTTPKADFLFRKFLFLLYKFSGEKSDLEWYTSSGVSQT